MRCLKNILTVDNIACGCGLIFIVVGLAVVFSGWITSWIPFLTSTFDELSDTKFIAGLTIFGLGFGYLAYLATKPPGTG